MKVTVRDPNILSNLDPQQLSSYLKVRGWLLESHIDGKESVGLTQYQMENMRNMILPYHSTPKLGHMHYGWQKF
jgi:hypothetical protein